MKIYKEPTLKFKYVFSFSYDEAIVIYLKSIKAFLGLNSIRWDEKAWRFNNLDIMELILKKYPQVEVHANLYDEILLYEAEKKQEILKEKNAIKLKKAKDSDILINGLKLDLYPYQKVGVEFMDNGDGRVILADSMGIGKTAQALGYVVHKKIEKTLVICPASVKYSWDSEIKKFTKLKSYIVESTIPLTYEIMQENDIIIINYDLLKKNFNNLASYSFDACIIDEFHCFKYDTKVLTSKGYIKIGDIVENKLSVSVASCNPLSNEIEYDKISNYFKNLSPKKLIKIKHRYGEFTCTENHKIWTKNGYKEARSLLCGEKLRVLSEKISNSKKRKINSTILQSQMCWFCSKQTSDSSSGYKKVKETACDKKMFNLWTSLCNKISWKSFSKKKILWNKLFCKMENETDRNKIKDLYKRKKQKMFFVDEKSTRKKSFMGKRSFKTDEKDEQKSSLQKKNRDCVIKISQRESNVLASWWKWKINKASTVITQINWIANGICNYYKKSKGILRMFTEQLSGGLSLSTKKDSDRSRWKFSFNKKMEIFRQKKNKDFRISRVESIEILEQRSDERYRDGNKKNKFIYNLEIENNNNYFAENVLVSNCIKNSQAQRTKATKSIVSKIDHVLLLSGTPMLNMPVELFNGLNLIDPEVWNDYYSFTVRYCAGHRGPWGWEAKGASNIEELQKRINKYFIRRTKEEVLPDLPKKQYTSQPVKLEKEWMDKYMFAERSFVEYLRQEKQKIIPDEDFSATKLIKLNELRQITSAGKIWAAKELIQSIIDNGEKVLVFSVYNKPLEDLQEHFSKTSILLTGKTDSRDRKDIVERFQDDKKISVFLGGMRSAGVGITLTAASNVIFLDFSYVPADHKQSEDRCHRIGQNAESINVYQLYSTGTIDEDMTQILKRKQKLFDQIIDGKGLGTTKKKVSLFDDIIKILEKK